MVGSIREAHLFGDPIGQQKHKGGLKSIAFALKSTEGFLMELTPAGDPKSHFSL